jgi:DNA-binding CsgD family transcriptional regulator/PAS domain-containing protein
MHRADLDLVGDIYDCVVAPERWPAVLETVAQQVRGECAILTLQDPVRREVRLLSSWNCTPKAVQAMGEHTSINPMMSAGWHMALDEPTTPIRFLGRAGWCDSRFYKVAVAPNHLHDGIMTLVAKTNTRQGGLTIPRSSDEPEYSDEDVARIRVLAPHIRRAVSISDLIDARPFEANLLSATVDLLGVGIILVDAEGRVVHANPAASALSKNTGLRFEKGRLSFRGAPWADALETAIQRATAGPAAAASAGISIRRDDEPGLAAWVLPVANGLRSGVVGSAAHAAIFLKALDDHSPMSAEIFVQRYGLTPAECRVLLLLVQGMSVTELSDALGLAAGTTRTHLKALFAKTGTHRQPDLVRLAMTAMSPVLAS